MPRGGKRVGAGRKPGVKRARVLPMAGVGRPTYGLPSPSGAPELLDESLLTPPDGLNEATGACWRAFAPEALRERTLTTATAAGFRQLCQQWDFVTTIHAEIEHRGAQTRDAEGLLRSYIRLSQRLDASLARFKLTAFGKPTTPEKPKVAANPWAQIGR